MSHVSPRTLIHRTNFFPVTSRVRKRSRDMFFLDKRSIPRTVQAQQSTAAVCSLAHFHKGIPLQDVAASIFTAGAAFLFVKSFDKLAEWEVFDPKTSRKLLHLLTGPLFVLCWPFYTEHPYAKFVAILTPTLNFIRLVLVGCGKIEGKFTVKAASRSGDRYELLRGPMYYVLMLLFVTFLWRQSPLSMLVMCTVCVGDGLADLLGRRFGQSMKLPYNGDKSVVGTASMFFFGTLSCIGFLCLFRWLGYFGMSTSQLIHTSLAVSLAAALVESLPLSRHLDDNISVPVVSFVLGKMLLQM